MFRTVPVGPPAIRSPPTHPTHPSAPHRVGGVRPGTLLTHSLHRRYGTPRPRPSGRVSDGVLSRAPVPEVVVYITRGLFDALLEMAAAADPDDISVVLASTPVGEFEGGIDSDLDLDADTAVLTHFYFPETSGSVNAVFGVDLGTPAGQGRARFVSHPTGRLEATREDTFAAALLIAVPPWNTESIAAFDRNDRKLDLDVVDAEPPEETLVE